ncbi:FadR family transcriptional regulator [Trebonia kvetii]|uniref:FadR family transcriptional regulator n=1 Tax=Trebonia kvetii TaxID=2480626 RepID=A0A6P2C6R7_9ACTN|nr:GntR family transcriptional regulator [Trebonia kvetii]TVZ06677.1 FadR family transcriptional regulator [Trebonia kvetii]
MTSQENASPGAEASPGEDAEQLPAPGRNLWVSLAQSNADLTDQPRRPAKTAETVAAAIVRDIVSRNLGPGDTLPSEAAMLAHYRVSRASLREALRLLEVQELIRLKPGPGGGPIVTAVDPRNLAKMTTLYLHLGGATYQELFEAVLVMAPISAERAARNGDRSLVSAAMKPFLLEEQPLQGPAYWTVTNEFHGSVEALAGNRVIELLGRIVGNIWHEHIVTRMDTGAVREQIHAEHRDIAMAIMAKQPSKAARLMRDHFAGLVEEYRRHWPGRFDELIEWD